MTAREKDVLERLFNSFNELSSGLNEFKVQVSNRLEKIEAAVVDLRTGAIREVLEEAERLKRENGGGKNGKEG